MTNFREFGAVVAVLAAASVLLAPVTATADHETPPPAEPQQQQHEPAPAPEPFQPRPAWPSGFYYLMSFDMGDSANPQTDAGFGVDLDWGVGMGLGVGYRVAGMLRLEGELHANWYRAGSLDLEPAAPFPVFDYSGGVWAVGAMANLVVDLPAWGSARPYLGAGYGFSRVAADYNESVCFIFCFSTENEVVDDWDFAEAWQAMAGISFSNPASSSEVFVGYRYFETDSLDFRTVSGTPFVQEGIKSHSLSVGIRFLM